MKSPGPSPKSRRVYLGAEGLFTFHGSRLLERLLAEPLGFLRCVYPDSSGFTPVEMTGDGASSIVSSPWWIGRSLSSDRPGAREGPGRSRSTALLVVNPSGFRGGCVDGWMGGWVDASMRSLPRRPGGCALSGQGCGAVSRFTFHVSRL